MATDKISCIKYYAGIGSRRTPDNILTSMTAISAHLQEYFTLRSGGAPGADIAFENGVSNENKEIYIPWKGFSGNNSSLYEQSDEAFYIASQFHPYWNGLKPSVRKLHARNVHQILGKDLNSPVEFVLAWTPDGCENNAMRSKETGGTGQAISIADSYNIEIINMKNLLWQERLEEKLNDLGIL